MDLLSGVRSFVAVARHRSFSAAATAEASTQPVVSRRVAALEEQLGRALFDRSTRRVALTAFGASVLDHGRRLLAAEAAFWEAAAATRVATVTMIVPPDLDPGGWAEVILRARAGGLDVDLTEVARDQRPLSVRTGDVDAAVVAVESSPADWTVELGIGHHRDDPGDSALFLRPVRAAAARPLLLVLAEDAVPGRLGALKAAVVRLGLGAEQVQSAGSTVRALADTISGDARVLCSRLQARQWGLDWFPAPELSSRRHYRLETADPGTATALRRAVGTPIGRALGSVTE